MENIEYECSICGKEFLTTQEWHEEAVERFEKLFKKKYDPNLVFTICDDCHIRFMKWLADRKAKEN